MIIKVLICHPDPMFTDFLSRYLSLSGFETKAAHDCIEGFAQCVHFKPQLVIANKKFKGMEAKGLLLKKASSQATENIPVFLIGDFSSAEIIEFKKLGAYAFVSTPVNPVIVVERLFNFFGIPLPPVKKTVPMLMDLCARGNIIVAQLEGNLEPEKLELFNYYIRYFCSEKEIKQPRILLIVPSLYAESVNEENVALLFRFLTFPELKIEDHYVKILTAVPRLLSFLKMNPDYARFELATDFLSALQTLQIDFDKRKSVPVEFIKEGSIYIFDLYDGDGKRIIPAHTPVSAEMLAYLASRARATLSYFSDFSPAEIERDALEFDTLSDAERALEILSSAYEPVVSEHTPVSVLDEKLLLFFRHVKNQPILLVSSSRDVREIIAHTLDVYFKIESPDAGATVADLLQEKHYMLIFLDAHMGMPGCLDLLREIRMVATRRKTSVIILAEQINKADVLRLKDSGTDNIILAPYSASKLLQKVYEAIDADRRS
jgi:DNA-binding response OmpR family regulator